MSFFYEIYQKKLADNENCLRFWEDYLLKLQALDFGVFAEKLKVPILVPIGSRIFFQGVLKHTSEVTVALGADYFAKCSLKQAEVLKQHRIKDAQTKVQQYKKEKEYLEHQLTFKKQKVYEDEGQDIVEVYNEEEEKVWRDNHKENVRRYKQKQSKKAYKENEVNDEELWNRLEELELQEEMEIELINSTEQENRIEKDHKESFVIKDDVHANVTSIVNDNLTEFKVKSKLDSEKISEFANKTNKMDLLERVINKQNELEDKLQELKSRDHKQSKTKKDLLSRLDEMDKLDELEDDMNRLESIIETEDSSDSDEETSISSQHSKLKKGVTFADQDDSETLELTFHHSLVEPSKEAFDPNKGIQKPSDIYKAYSNLFSDATSILKKTKYEDKVNGIEMPKVKEPSVKFAEVEEYVRDRTIEIKDVVQKVDKCENTLESDSRPVSLFKKRRQQMKS